MAHYAPGYPARGFHGRYALPDSRAKAGSCIDHNDAVTTPPVDGRLLNPRGFRWLAVALLVALTAPRMVQRGMFVDGMFYASVARNLARGQGTVWAPSYSSTVYAQYFEQPPLGIALESVAYRVGGDHFAVERVYSLVMLGLTACLMAAIWRQFFPARYDWLPVCLWVLPAVVTWAAVNNMLENTQAAATAAATYAMVRAVRNSFVSVAVEWGALGGLLIAFAALTKGPVGLFPLAVPALSVILRPADRPRVGWATVAMAFVVGAAALTMTMLPAPRHALEEYVHQQLGPTFDHRPPVLVQVVAVWRHLLGGILLRLAIVVAALWLVRRRAIARPAVARAAWFFLGIGLAASLPLMVSPKINGHYLVPSVVFFALAAAAVALPPVESFAAPPAGALRRKVPAALACGLLLAAALVVAIHGTLERRDPQIVASMDSLSPLVPRGAVLGTCATASHEWGLLAYLQRFLQISLDPRGQAVGGWFVQPSEVECPPPVLCQRSVTNSVLTLYRCAPTS
jgi:4-amino-4-deoxy-L-arabinose transferase-like glycosyltransferase